MESLRLLRVQMLVLWLCVLGSSSLLAETRHLHVIKLFDNENHDYVIREGCRSIGFGIDQEVAMLANHLGILNVIEYNLSGPDFNLERLDQVLNYEMAYQERDIIMLVYIGHGFRDASTTSTFPNLYFKSYTESVNFSEIREQILEMNPSLLMNIVLACNVTISDYSEPPPFRSDNQPPEVVTLPKSGRHHGIYQGLFADEPSMTKVIDLVSADREYFTFLSLDGGIFFNEILYTFQEAMGGYPYHGWQEICATIARRTEERSQRKGMQQKPVCQYNVRLSPVVLPAPRTASLFEPSPCQMAARDLRKMQRGQLRQLRRQHRQNMREARRSGAARSERRLISQKQRVEYESQKLRHEKEYQRRLLQCR